jgi:porin
LDLNTSFTGTDSLRILLETGSGGGTTNVTGLLEPTFGSVIDFSVKPPTRNTIGIGRLVYAFKPNPDLQVAIGPDIRISDYVVGVASPTGESQSLCQSELSRL